MNGFLPVVPVLGHISSYSSNCNIIFIGNFKRGGEVVGCTVVNDHHTRGIAKNLPCCVLKE